MPTSDCVRHFIYYKQEDFMKKIITLILAAITCFSVVMTGCDMGGGNGAGNGSSGDNYLVYEDGVTYNDGIGEYDTGTMTETKSDYDRSVFYRNDIVAMTADPFVLYCTDETNEQDYDHYFLFGTTTWATFNCFKSKDLVSWEPESVAYMWPKGGWQGADTWAPEVVYDPDASREFYGVDDKDVYGDRGTGVYFMFCSASAKADFLYWTDDKKDDGNSYKLDLAVAAQPQGPYKQWTGVEKGTEINGVDYGTEAGIKDGYTYTNDINVPYVDYDNTVKVARDNNEVTLDDSWWNPAAARASLSFQWENKHLAGNYVKDGVAVSKETEGATWVPEEAKYMVIDEGLYCSFSCIDPNPYIDPNTGEKILFLTRDYPNSKLLAQTDEYGMVYRGSAIYAVKMLNDDWAQVDYSTITRLTRTGFNFISGAARDAYMADVAEGTAESVENIPAMGPSSTEDRLIVELEGSNRVDNYINEGPQVTYNPDNGLYYLTFSAGRYKINCYSVIQCVSYNLFGPYRKLEVGEGGYLLTTDNGKATDAVSGPGHHTLLNVYDNEAGREPELFMVYHKHRSIVDQGATRGACIDRVVWVKNSNGLDVMHTNGPTTYMQPRIYATGETEYDNLAVYPGTTITVSDPDKIVDLAHGVQNLNDNVLAIHSEYEDEDWEIPVEPFIHEFETTAENLTITVDLGAYYPVVAYMLYNSRQLEKAFTSKDYDDFGWFNDIQRVEMDIYKDGKKAIAVFEGLEFYRDFCLFTSEEDIRPGSAASAVFAEIAVKQIRFTVVNTTMSGILAISEVAVLGKPEAVEIA